MASNVSGLSVRRVSFVKRGATRDPDNPTEPHRRLLWKAENPDEGASAPKGAGMPTLEETQAALAKAERERDEFKAALEKARKERKGEPSDDDSDDDPESKKGRDEKGQFEKSELPEAARVAFEKQERELAELKKAAEKAEEIAKQERTLREEREFITKAETEFTHLGKAEELGPELMRMKGVLSKEDYDRHLERLAAANEQLSKGALFREYGVNGSGVKRDGAQDAYSLALSKAQELRKSDSGLTEVAAMERAMKNPDVQAAYARERA